MGNIFIKKTRATKVETISMVAGFIEVLERDKKGKPFRTKWHPQTLKNEKGEETVITVNVPIEGQFNNNLGVDFYLRKGYLLLGDAEERLAKDFPHLLQNKPKTVKGVVVEAEPKVAETKAELDSRLVPKAIKPRKAIKPKQV